MANKWNLTIMYRLSKAMKCRDDIKVEEVCASQNWGSIVMYFVMVFVRKRLVSVSVCTYLLFWLNRSLIFMLPLRRNCQL